MTPLRLLLLFPVAESLQAELQHPFRLTFLRRNQSHHILVQSNGDHLGIDICCETKLVFLLSNTAHQCVVLLGLILYLLIVIFHSQVLFSLQNYKKNSTPTLFSPILNKKGRCPLGLGLFCEYFRVVEYKIIVNQCYHLYRVQR